MKKDLKEKIVSTLQGISAEGAKSKKVQKAVKKTAKKLAGKIEAVEKKAAKKAKKLNDIAQEVIKIQSLAAKPADKKEVVVK